jgi:hypothetical protein
MAITPAFDTVTYLNSQNSERDAIGFVFMGSAPNSAPITVGGVTALVAATTMTRPADTTAYAVGDLVANNTTAGSVTPLAFQAARVAGGSGAIWRVRAHKSSNILTNASFRLHLYNAIPTVTNGDNGAWLSNGAANYMGSMDFTFSRPFTDGASGFGIPESVQPILFALASGQTIWGLIEARGTYAPASVETFTLALDVMRD